LRSGETSFRGSSPASTACNRFGLVGDAAIGIVGALIGDWLLHRLGVHLSSGVIGLVINATIGAIVLLLVLRVMGASGWGGR